MPASAAFFSVLFLTALAPPQTPPQLPPGAEAMSLFGKPLHPPEPSAEARASMEADLAAAQKAYEASPTDADALIWLGRRTAYLGRFREAIAIYAKGIAQHPGDPRLYRHRGHRHISVREFDRAVADFRTAAELIEGRPDEVEPDGQPNPRNIPTSTLQFNIWYHLGLAHYLQGEFDRALEAYRRCMAVSKNPDAQAATSYWLYMTLRRLERPAEAARVLEPIGADMEIIENDAYHRLLLMFKGELEADALLGPDATPLQLATVGYGVGNWHLINGRRDQARDVFTRILEGPQWAAFGYIAGEADLKRMTGGS